MQDPLDAVRRFIADANGLPNAHYIDPDVHAEENDALLSGGWAGLAVASEVPDPGDALPIEFLGAPLLLLRDKIGIVRVLQNTCRHRGMILIDAPGNIEGAIRCPYHSWCYATDGRLVSTPHVGGPGTNKHEGIDRTTLGLIEIRSHIWRDVVWINMDGNALPFREAMAEVIDQWADFAAAELYHGGSDSRFTLQVNCNWKLAVENYCESYHLPWIHPGLNAYSRLEDHYNIESRGAFSGQGTTVYRQLKGDDGKVFPDFPDLPKKWDTAAEYIAVYPNVLLGVHRDHAYSIVLHPKGTEATLEHVHLYYAREDTDCALRVANTTQWRDIFEEDIFVVEGMQKGRHGPHFDGGRFSPVMDGPTHCFHEWVADRVTAHRDKIK